MSRDLEAAPSLLVLRLSALGDVIHAIPAVALLRARFAVSWAVEASYAELVETVSGARAIPLRLKRWGKAPLASRSDMAEALRRLRGHQIAVDFQGLIKSAVLARVSGAGERYGFDRAAIREKAAGIFLNRRVAVDTRAHVVDWNLELARAVAGRVAPAPEQWDAFPEDSRQRLGSLQNRIVLLPGAGRAEKVWPIERLRAVARHFGAQSLVVWGPGERKLADQVEAPMAPETNLRELAFLLGKAKMVVGADTGPLHLAAALGTPVVGLFGPTDPRRNGPYGQLDGVIDHFRGSRTMESITVDEVIAAVEKGVER